MTKRTERNKRRGFGPLARVATAASMATASAVAGAQATSTGSESTLQEVVVTGSRIAAPNQTSTSPIVSVSREDLKVTGRADISDVITQLPQNFNNSLGQDLGNRTSGLSSAGGVATADLRGLGPNRSLVLVDGIRLGQGSPNTAIASPGPDLDQIPSALLERVDVLTGGASATYGSDAIAGVINFITRKDFEGFEIDAQVGENWRRNKNTYMQELIRNRGGTPATGTARFGRSRLVSLVAGSNFADGKGNLTAFFTYYNQDPVRSADVDYGGCQLTIDARLSGAACGGSSNSNYFRPRSGPSVGTLYNVSGNGFVPFGSVPTTPPAVFNSQPYIYMARANQRYQAGVIAHNDLTSVVKPYFRFFFTNDRSFTEVAPSALFRNSNPNDPNSGNYNVNCSNPLLSAQQQSILCTPAQIAADRANPGSATANIEIGRRNIEGGGRSALYEHTSYRGVLGAKGDLGDGAWSYDAYGQFYYVQFYNSNDKYLNYQNIDRALLVTGTAANPVCVSGPPCVPYNIFKDGGVTKEALDYLQLAGTANGSTTTRTLHADVTGYLGKYGIKSPLANDGLAFNLGFEHRTDLVTFRPDAAELSGQLAGFGGASVAINNSISVKEGFAELRAPLVQDRPGVNDLLFNAGYRHSDYSTAGGVNTYKFELQYAPIRDVRLRASYNRAIRAPSVIELYNPQLVGQIQIGLDPCAPTTNASGAVTGPPSASLAQCLRTVPAAQQAAFTALYNAGLVPQGTAGQLSQLQGGNTRLVPEQGDTYTFGINFQPSAIPDLIGSIDYYRIRLKNVVSALPATSILTNCLNAGDPLFCSQIVRSPATGGLTGASVASGGYIVQTSVNIGAGLVSGIDLQGAYKLHLPAGLGTVGLALNGAWLQRSQTTPYPGSGTFDCVGLFGPTCQTINPRWRHTLRASWSLPYDLTASLTWRYMGAVKLDHNTGDPLLQFPQFGTRVNSYNARIGSYSWLDLAATWSPTRTLEVRVGVNNILDKDPPLVTTEIISGGAANTYESYDSFGRQLFAAFTARF